LKSRTVAFYEALLEQKIYPELGDVPLNDITPHVVRNWYNTLDAEHPTRRAHAYTLLKSILAGAVNEDLLVANPCRIRGAGNSKRVHEARSATLGELEKIIAALPNRHRLMILLASWCALRFGELTELRRSDIDIKAGKIMVRRAVVFLHGRRLSASRSHRQAPVT
jgi:integrase